MSAEVSGGDDDAGGPGESVEADGEVAQGGHHRGGVAGADLGEVLRETTSRIECSRFSIPDPPRAPSQWRLVLM